MLENNVFQRAKDAINHLMNTQGEASENDRQAAENAINDAYQNASPEEQQQLQQLEEHLKQSNHLE